MANINLEAQAERVVRSKVAANQYHKEALKILVDQGWQPTGEWMSCDDKMPSSEQDGVYFYTFEYGEVRADCWYSAFPRDDDGWSSGKCKGNCFYTPNSDSDYGGEFKSSGTTHWMVKPNWPEPPVK